ncbi:MAG TPA: VOC family protein [Bryobacteraceae bacterium]|jgi:uncharacterized glyoxalase superfamily protein PhnB|nr:VOC family protein [Bryobacteraceae bacterium]
MVKKITAVLIVDEVEPCSKFWVERMGFEEIAAVPDGDRIAFSMLKSGNTELMYQSLSSALKDTGAVAKADATWLHTKPVTLYIEVENLDKAIAAMQGAKVAMEQRTTFYGAKEFGVFDPAGHFIMFAEMAAAAA